jgi:hypothetical protein
MQENFAKTGEGTKEALDEGERQSSFKEMMNKNTKRAAKSDMDKYQGVKQAKYPGSKNERRSQK